MSRHSAVWIILLAAAIAALTLLVDPQIGGGELNEEQRPENTEDDAAEAQAKSLAAPVDSDRALLLTRVSFRDDVGSVPVDLEVFRCSKETAERVTEMVSPEGDLDLHIGQGGVFLVVESANHVTSSFEVASSPGERVDLVVPRNATLEVRIHGPSDEDLDGIEIELTQVAGHSEPSLAFETGVRWAVLRDRIWRESDGPKSGNQVRTAFGLLQEAHANSGEIVRMPVVPEAELTDREGVARFVGIPASDVEWSWSPSSSPMRILCEPVLPHPPVTEEGGVDSSYSELSRSAKSAPISLAPGQTLRVDGYSLEGCGIRGQISTSHDFTSVILRVRHVTRMGKYIGRDHEVALSNVPIPEFEVLGLLPGEKTISIVATDASGDYHVYFAQEFVEMGSVLDLGNLLEGASGQPALIWNPIPIGSRSDQGRPVRGTIVIRELAQEIRFWETIELSDAMKSFRLYGLPASTIVLRLRVSGGAVFAESGSNRLVMSDLVLSSHDLVVDPQVSFD